MTLTVKNSRDATLQAAAVRINEEGLPPEWVIPGLKQVQLKASHSHFRVLHGGAPEGPGFIQLEATLINIVGTPVFTAYNDQGPVPLTDTENDKVKLLNFSDMGGNRVEIHVEVEDQSVKPFTVVSPPEVFSDEVAITKVYDRPPLPVENLVTGLNAEGKIDSIVITVFSIVPVADRAIELWRATANDFLQAVKVAEFEGTQYEDRALGVFNRFYYWARVVDKEYGTQSLFVGPTTAQTGQVTSAIEALEGKLSATELVQGLNDRIDLIDAPATAAGSVNQRLASLGTQVGEDMALLWTDVSTLVDQEVGTVSQQVTTLSTTVDGNTSTLQQQSQSIGGLSAEWTLKLDINGRVSGIGLASDPEGVSDFTVLTDRFSILDANDPTKVVLGTVNGQTYIRGAYIDQLVANQIDTRGLTIKDDAGEILFGAGVELDGTFIKNGSIGNAKIAGMISSDNFDKETGWAIYKTGVAIFNNATIRGTLEAPVVNAATLNGGTITGAVIVGTSYLTPTDAGDPYYTYQSIQNRSMGGVGNYEYPGSGRRILRVRATSPFRAYNIGGTVGTEFTDRYVDANAYFFDIDIYVNADYSGDGDTSNIRLNVIRSDTGEVLQQINYLNSNQANTRTQNGTTITRNAYRSGVPAGGRGSIRVTGAFTYSYTGDYPVAVELYMYMYEFRSVTSYTMTLATQNRSNSG